MLWQATGRALCLRLLALSEPTEQLRPLELAGDYTARLVLLEKCKTLASAAVCDYYCQQESVPTRAAWLATVRAYESTIPSQRGS